jgi:D-alanyl-D-alanine carboxypeptidase (penicillin-binding protein 5/6)
LKKIALMIVISLLLCGRAAAAPGISAKAAILCLPDGRVLYESNADARMLIASTTKIMTALVVLENCAPDEVVKVTAKSTAVEGSSMYLKPGEELTVEELLYGMLICSGNDAAHALALHTAGSIEAFAELMNNKAAELGLENTSFRNPHGLDEEGHYSTAADLAKIASAAMGHELFREIVATKNKVVAGRSLVNHNKLLWSYEGAMGVKTGYTKAAGRTRVSSAEREGFTLICVTLCAPDDWDDHMKLYDWAFSQYNMHSISEKGREYCRLPVISGVAESVGVRCSEDFSLLLKNGDGLETKALLPKFVYAPVREGEIAGSIEVSVNGEVVKTIPLVYSESVEQDEKIKLDFWGRIKRWWILGNLQVIKY